MENEYIDDCDDLWLLNLQEFLDTADVGIENPNVKDNIQQHLHTLESTDGNFHRYSLIQQIQEKLENELSSMINKEIDQKSLNSDDTMIAADISKMVLESDSFRDVSTNIIDSVKYAAENISNIIKSNTFDFFPESAGNNSNSKEENFMPDDSICSTVDGVEFMFMSADHFKSLANEIDCSKPVIVRSEAFTTLQQVPQSDLVSSEVWKLMQEKIMVALDDEVEEINLIALQFLSRLFVCGNCNVVKEYLLTLIENLIEYFNDSTSHMVSIDAGLDLGDRRNIILMRKFRLLDQIVTELPLYWLRYTDKMMEEVVLKFINLLCIIPMPISETIGKHLMSPVHFLSLVDPHGIWFKNWIHGLYGRSYLFNAIEKCPNLLKQSVESLLEILSEFESATPGSPAEDYIFYFSSDIKYMHFVHSVNLLSRIMLYKNGCKLFSAHLKEKLLSIELVLQKVVDLLRVLKIDKHNDSYLDIYQVIGNLLTSASCGQTNHCHKFLCNTSVCTSLLQIISENDSNGHLQRLSAEILVQIACCLTGRNVLLKLENSHGMDVISNLVSNCMQGVLKVNDDVFMSLLDLMCHIYCTSEGVILLRKKNVVDLLYKHLTDLSTEKPANSSRAIYAEHSEFAYKLACKFLSFASTPKGLEMIEKSGGLESCLTCIMNESKLREEKSIGCSVSCFMQHLIATTNGVQALTKCGYVGFLLEDTWFQLELCTNDYTKTVMQNIPEDLTHPFFKQLYDSITTLLSSFPAVRLLCQHPSEDKYVKTFHSFMDEFILIDEENKRRSLVHKEQTHLFALNVLSFVASCLDSIIFLEAKYKCSAALLRLQEECFYEDSFMIDRCALLRNVILIKTYYFGGENERFIPPLTLTQDAADPFPWPLFSSYPPPGIYQKLPATVHNQRSSQLDEFLRKHQDGMSSVEAIEYGKKLFFEEIRDRNIQSDVFGKFLLWFVSSSNSGVEENVVLSSCELMLEEDLAMELIVRYAFSLNLVKSKDKAKDGLKEVLLKVKQRQGQHFRGFDWFTAIIFMIYRADCAQSLSFLKTFLRCKQARYIWPASQSSENMLYTDVCHYVDLVIENELYHVHAVFQLAAYPSVLTSLHWLRQSFLNYLNWPDVVMYTCGCVIVGKSFQVCFCVAVFKHLQELILSHQQEGDLVNFLRTNPVRGFCARRYLPYITKLVDKYDDVIR